MAELEDKTRTSYKPTTLPTRSSNFKYKKSYSKSNESRRNQELSLFL